MQESMSVNWHPNVNRAKRTISTFWAKTSQVRRILLYANVFRVYLQVCCADAVSAGYSADESSSSEEETATTKARESQEELLRQEEEHEDLLEMTQLQDEQEECEGKEIMEKQIFFILSKQIKKPL